MVRSITPATDRTVLLGAYCRQQGLPVCADLHAHVNMLNQTFVGNDGVHLLAEPSVSEIAASDKTQDPHLLICKGGELPAESWGVAPAVAREGGADLTSLAHV